MRYTLEESTHQVLHLYFDAHGFHIVVSSDELEFDHGAKRANHSYVEILSMELNCLTSEKCTRTSESRMNLRKKMEALQNRSRVLQKAGSMGFHVQ